mmetsp:Transcript_21306/g.36290  ORF Transcript_21306/g.36290 Transcript_21306/m.36290 type:complete len:238 (+) Transcript_21306:20-733(+)
MLINPAVWPAHHSSMQVIRTQQTARWAQAPVHGRVQGRRCSPALTAPRSRRANIKVAALFGWGQKDTTKDDEKEEAYQAQQELLAKRRNGSAVTEASERRSNVRKTVAAKKAERQNERDELGEGRMPDTLLNWKNYKKKEDADGTSGIIVPLLPFGRVDYDEGERFDLRSPYADDGWVSPDEVNMMQGFMNAGKKLLNFTGKSIEPTERKPIIWASKWAKYQGEEAAKKAAQKEAQE